LKKLLIFSTLLYVSLACGGKAEGTSTANGSPKEALAAAVEEVVSSSGNGDCILSYQRKIDELLTLDLAKKHYTGDLSKAEVKYRKSAPERKADTDKCGYEWPSDRVRTMNFGGNTMKIPMSNEIAVQWIGSDLFMMDKKKSALENFKRFYRNASKEEKEKAFTIAEKVVQNKEGISKETAKAATGIAKGMASDDIIFEYVAGIGNAAAWRIKDNYLTVLVGDITFQVIADVDKDNKVNLELAKKIAADILAKCK